MKTTISIGEVAKASGIAASAIRYYEAIGLLPPATRVNGRRLYNSQMIQRLYLIQFCQRAGFALAEIHQLFFGFAHGTHPSVRWETFAGQKLTELEAQIEHLQTMKQVLLQGLQCGCLTIEECALWLSGDDSQITPEKMENPSLPSK
jgi:MerR family redox-sensitive transcriptional activator SoxR